MSDPYDPREVLEAVQRLESDLDDVRVRARRVADPALARLRDEITAYLAADRQRTLEDMSAIVDVVEASWRAQQREHASLSEDVARLDERLAQIAGAMALLSQRMTEVVGSVARVHETLGAARVEVRFGPPADAAPEAEPVAAPANGVDPEASGDDAPPARRFVRSTP